MIGVGTATKNWLRFIRHLFLSLPLAFFSIACFGQPGSINYCSGSFPPPAPPECPALNGVKAECVGPIVGPSFWYAVSWNWSSAPACNSMRASVGGQCASEYLAWLAWRNSIGGGVCQEPVRSYTCTNVIGTSLSTHSFLQHKYDIVMGLGTPQSCNSHNEGYANSGEQRDVYCPATYYPYGGSSGLCMRLKPEACPAGNPIQCAGGQKVQREQDLRVDGSGDLNLTRYYSSTGFYSSPRVERTRDALGSHWRHSWQSSVVVEEGLSAGQSTFAYVTHPDGDYRHFTLSGSTWVGRPDKRERLEEVIVEGKAGMELLRGE